MDPALFFRGLVIGFAIAAPVGPVGVLCIRRALADGRTAAFIAGLGAAFADTFYGAVAALGLTAVSQFLLEQQTALRLGGGAFMIVLGLRTYHTLPTIEPTPIRGPGLVKDFLSSFSITLTNPATILAFMGVFAAMGAMGIEAGAGADILITGVFFGSALWWLVLSAAAGAVRSRFTPDWLRRLNHGSGVALVVFGVAILGSLLY
ncbi:MAG: LysE family transporter [Rhodospirillales bacterium]|nr:LysE family transporter [Rhodospirillales bacterium]